MLKIGDFSKIFNVTIKTIRFYEEKELLKPYYIDKYSGYRYYNDENIKQMSKIMYLKNLGFSLEEIKNYDENLVKTKIEEYQAKIMQYTSNINILKDIETKKQKGEEVKTFINDKKAIGKWELIGVSTTKENAKKHIFENGKFIDIKELYLLENGEKYWIISWSKNYIYIKGKENTYEIDGKYMYIEILYPEDKSLYMVAVYEKVNNKKYTQNEIRKKDKFDGYYREDYRIIGFWKIIDFLKIGQRFNYRKIKNGQDFELERITVNPIENQVIAYINKKTKILKYTKNSILNLVYPDTKCHYEYKRINGKEYLFLEWKTEDYIFNKKIDGYYVLEKIGGINYMEEMFEKKDKIYSILTREEKGLTLGKEIILPENKRGNVNALVVAGSGAGKSASYTIPNILKMLGSYIITDPIGEIYDKTHTYLKNNGYKIKVLNYENRDIQNNIDEEDKYQYNPISHIKSDTDVENLANILIGNEDEEFLDEACKSLMKAVIYYVIKEEDNKDLLTCFKLMGLPKEKLFEKFDTFEENTKEYKYYTILKSFPEKTYQL